MWLLVQGDSKHYPGQFNAESVPFPTEVDNFKSGSSVFRRYVLDSGLLGQGKNRFSVYCRLKTGVLGVSDLSGGPHQGHGDGNHSVDGLGLSFFLDMPAPFAMFGMAPGEMRP